MARTPTTDCFIEKKAIQIQLVSDSTSVRGESIGWHGSGGKMGLDTLRYSTRVYAGETRPYRMGLSRIAGRT
jgi:hypothetical protein